mmetsp:Transcript_72329/g.211932  ORF Transcript_72329/g.211932 Transcript_72329/m.211932 type:complete len:180 (+) Transcript_72329:97-636(+)
MEALGGGAMMQHNALVPDVLVGPAATVMAVTALGAAVYASLSVALAQRRGAAKVPKERRQRRQQRTAGAKEVEAHDLEMGLISPQKKRRKSRGRRTKMQKLMQFFIAQDSASEAGSECGDGPFELDDESWLTPGAEPPRSAEQHFIGDGLEASPGADAAEDAFGLADELWRAPPAASLA